MLEQRHEAARKVDCAVTTALQQNASIDELPGAVEDLRDASTGVSPILHDASAAEKQEQLFKRTAAIQLSRPGRYKRLHYNIAVGIATFCFLAGLPVSLALGVIFQAIIVPVTIMGLLISVGGFFAIPVILVASQYNYKRSSERDPMPKEQGVMAIGPLLDRMFTDVTNAHLIRMRLADELPGLDAGNVQLERRHYTQLNLCLQKAAWEWSRVGHQERRFLLALLDAYSRVGDPRAMRHIERIERGMATSQLRDPEVRTAAARCIAYLRQLEADLKQHGTLLRPSSGADLPSELLRPNSARTTDETHLLRSTSSSETMRDA